MSSCFIPVLSLGNGEKHTLTIFELLCFGIPVFLVLLIFFEIVRKWLLNATAITTGSVDSVAIIFRHPAGSLDGARVFERRRVRFPQRRVVLRYSVVGDRNSSRATVSGEAARRSDTICHRWRIHGAAKGLPQETVSLFCYLLSPRWNGKWRKPWSPIWLDYLYNCTTNSKS